MFKLPNGLPSLRNSAQDWADYAEYSVLSKTNLSILSLVKTPLLISDETLVDGIEDDTDKFINKADEISAEINNRKSTTGFKYPFETSDSDYSIKFLLADSLHVWIYKFLLLCTRLNMKDEKIQSGLDGTQLFERLSAEVALNFFGNNAEVDILGTSKSHIGGFRAKLLEITKKMKEGGDIHQNHGYKPQDDNVDLIIWKGFSDKLPSQMIAFAQCKTGTSWQDRLSELNTESFCKTWFSRQPVVTPIRMFFCAQYFPKEIWHPRANEAGLVFDRFRILDYLPDTLDDTLLQDIKAWCLAIEVKFSIN
jgi:hypothetical protein